MMRKIEPTTQFKRDYKREKKGKYREILETTFTDILKLLANDKPLPENIATMRFQIIGMIIVSAILNRIWF